MGDVTKSGRIVGGSANKLRARRIELQVKTLEMQIFREEIEIGEFEDQIRCRLEENIPNARLQITKLQAEIAQLLGLDLTESATNEDVKGET